MPCYVATGAQRSGGGLARSQTTRFGEVFTLDHIVNRGEGEVVGCKGKRDAVILTDLWSDYMLVIPVGGKSAEQAYEALREFRGTTYPQRVHTDNSPELVDAVRMFGFHHTTSARARPQRNGVIEVRVGLTKRHSRAILRQAGIPANGWPWSMSYWACARNFWAKGDNSDQPNSLDPVPANADAQSPYELRFPGERYWGHQIPFGAAVDFQIPATGKVADKRRGKPIYRTRTQHHPRCYVRVEVAWWKMARRISGSTPIRFQGGQPSHRGRPRQGKGGDH